MRHYSFLFTVIILLFCPLLCAASTSEQASDFLVEIGESALQGGDVTDAIHEFSKALLVNPDNKKAKWYLSQLHVDEGLYTTTRTKTAQIGEMARDIRDYQGTVQHLEGERYGLQKRVDLLEDAIERKGDHQLLEDIEDYYREAAFYDIDESLPRDQQLAALKEKHEEYKEYNFDKDRVQEKTIAVMGQLLGYREKHLEDAKDDFVHHRILLAKNRKDLLNKVDRLKKLQSEYDKIGRDNHYDAKKIRQLENDLQEARAQVDMLMNQRNADLTELKEKVNSLEQRL